ncbi:hypothetical protein DACRYDRAFT_109676 [Dacryopinax primogenitus]|uniref:F-box domain-containing protein n=1 Tax=Dacryopinax primogenitus (strain DJM 731) TaxID=1858805 RepID=M5FTW2_DACPD|nr:uncharacterized protein DACRYDRAFT_109676 [Dacryopinax primogenitus]EJT99578.1 hypothetical protein DACRYDRAFT_109676 [Dacryopinax primogenitus]
MVRLTTKQLWSPVDVEETEFGFQFPVDTPALIEVFMLANALEVAELRFPMPPACVAALLESSSSTLVHLEIETGFERFTSRNISMLRCLSRLRELKITFNWDDGNDSNAEPIPPVFLPQVKILNIGFFGGWHTCAHVLGALRIPLLLSVTLRFYLRDRVEIPVGVVHGFLNRHSATIQEFTITPSSTLQPSFISLLKSLRLLSLPWISTAPDRSILQVLPPTLAELRLDIHPPEDTFAEEQNAFFEELLRASLPSLKTIHGWSGWNVLLWKKLEDNPDKQEPTTRKLFEIARAFRLKGIELLDSSGETYSDATRDTDTDRAPRHQW